MFQNLVLIKITCTNEIFCLGDGKLSFQNEKALEFMDTFLLPTSTNDSNSTHHPFVEVIRKRRHKGSNHSQQLDGDGMRAVVWNKQSSVP